MAILYNNLLIQGASGNFNKQFVYRNYNGQIRLSKYPDMSKRELTPKQIRANKIMRKAIYKAKTVLYYEDSRIAAQVRLNLPANKLYHALKKEFLIQLYKEEAEKNKQTDAPGSPGNNKG